MNAFPNSSLRDEPRNGTREPPACTDAVIASFNIFTLGVWLVRGSSRAPADQEIPTREFGRGPSRRYLSPSAEPSHFLRARHTKCRKMRVDEPFCDF